MDIEKLIPQRDPIRMVDRLVAVDGDSATTELTLRPGNFFVDDAEGHIAEAGVIEHIAQSASAFAGYRAVEAGAKEPPVGFIGEVKRFSLLRHPQVGDVLTTTITMGPEAAGVTLIKGETHSGSDVVATTQMKIFIEK